MSYFAAIRPILSAFGGTSLTYYLTGTDSSIPGYESLKSLAQFVPTSEQSVAVAATTTPAIIEEFATDVGYPNITKLVAGSYGFHYETQKDAGPHGYYTYVELYKRVLAGTETLLFTSDNSSSTTLNTRIQQTVTGTLAADVTLLTTDRLVIKIYAVMLTNTATITLYWDDNTAARITLPYIPADATNFVPYVGATADVNLGAFGLTDSSSVLSVNPNARILIDVSNFNSINWGTRILSSNAGASILDYNSPVGAQNYGTTGTGFSNTAFTPRARIHAHESGTVAVVAKFTMGYTGSNATDGFDVGLDNIGVAELRHREFFPIKFYTSNTNYMTLAAGAPTLTLDSQATNSVNAGKIIYQTASSAESFTTTFNASDNNFYFLYGATTVGSVTSTGWGFGVTAFDNSATVHIRAAAEQLRIDNNGTSFTKITQNNANVLGFVPAVNNAAAFTFYKADGTTSVCIMDTTNGRFGINVQPTVALHALSTSEQMRIAYDASNYWKATTSSTGITTFDAVGSGSSFVFSDAVTIDGLLTLSAQNIATDTTTGMKIGTGTTQKIGLWNATPIVQPTTAIVGSTYTHVVSTGVHSDSTWDGYTIGQIVKALRNIGILA